MRKRGLGLFVLLLAGCGGDSTSPMPMGDPFEMPADQVLLGMNHRMTRYGVVTAILNSDSAYVYEQSRRFDLMGVDVTFYTEQGAQAGHLTSETGDYNLAAKVFIARGNVVLITAGPEGDRHLETEELHYDIDGDRIWTDSPFTLVEAGRTSRGTQFRTDSKFDRWEVTGLQTQGTVPEDAGTRF